MSGKSLLQRLVELFNGTRARLTPQVFAAGAAIAATSACSSSSGQSRETILPQSFHYDSTVIPFREQFVLTPAESVVVRCDTIRYRRVAGPAATPLQSVPSSGHASHASHGSHASH